MGAFLCQELFCSIFDIVYAKVDDDFVEVEWHLGTFPQGLLLFILCEGGCSKVYLITQSSNPKVIQLGPRHRRIAPETTSSKGCQQMRRIILPRYDLGNLFWGNKSRTQVGERYQKSQNGDTLGPVELNV